MRTGADPSDAGDEYLIPSQPPVELPLPPVPAHAAPGSPVSMMMPASVMSPDEMLRAYADRKMTSPPPGGPVSFPAASYNAHGMRTLYSPGHESTEYSAFVHTKQGSGDSIRQPTYPPNGDNPSIGTAN